MRSKIVRSLLFGLFIFSAAILSSCDGDGSTIPEYRPVTKTLDGYRFLYAQNVKRSPVVIMLHGGSQNMNDIINQPLTTSFYARGYTVIAPDSKRPYCPSRKQWDRTPQSVDMPFFHSLVGWIQSNRNINGKRIFVGGISSGGFMSSRICFDIGLPTIDGAFIYASGCANNCPIVIEDNCGLDFDLAEPVISSNHPPLFLLHGAKDKLVPVEMSDCYHNAMLKTGKATQLIVDPEAGHNWLNQYNDTVISWISNLP